MPSRKRYTPARGAQNRIVDPLERAAVWAAGLPLRAAALAAPRPEPLPFAPAALREVLVLRLDRIGDVTMTLPALSDLRAALPGARIRLAVGEWSAEIARRAPVDELLLWNAPWVGRGGERTLSWRQIVMRARALRGSVDLALDLSCDPRANYLLRATGAPRRVGYANSGFGSALTHVLPLDETVSWAEESRRAVAAITGKAGSGAWPPLASQEEMAAARARLAAAGLVPGKPIVALHPSGGRSIKQWALDNWSAVARRLAQEHGARFVLTGSSGDTGLTAPLAAALGAAAWDAAGTLTLAETLAVLAVVDLVLSPDTGPMHLACALDTPSVSVFGPSDPRRYFAGGSGAAGTRHVVVSAALWCAPCNQIRRPPAECLAPPQPECLQLVSVDAVYNAASRLLAPAAFP